MVILERHFPDCRHGMVLKQRANFYNNIATEMVPSQKPMLLKDALDFEKVLMNPKDAQV